MIQAKCIEKFRDKQNKIYGYRLVDLNGQTQDVTPENLKRAIKSGEINIINLMLTSDGRLIDKETKKATDVPKLGDYSNMDKNTIWLQEMIHTANQIYKELINNIHIKSKFNTENIDVFLCIDETEFYIHSKNTDVNSIKNIKTEQIFIDTKGEVDLHIGIACIADKRDKKNSFFMYLNFNILSNNYSISSYPDYTMIVPNEDKIWMNKTDLINYIKNSINKL